MRAAIRVAVIPLVLLCSTAGWSQTTSGSLTGAVRTADGQPVAGAVVQARSSGTGMVRTGITDGKGGYRIDLLNPGDWTVLARLSDGQVSESRSVTLRLQQTVQLDFTLGEGFSEQVTVKAERPLVDRMESAGMLLITGDQADTLPLSGRVFTDLAMLKPSVRQTSQGNFAGERGSVFQVNGQSGRANSFLVDGLDNNDLTSNTTLNSFFSQQVIQEFVLLTNYFAPEFGRASGATLNIVTKQGTNEPTWQAFLQGTSSDWNETGDFVSSLPDSGVSQDSVDRFQTGVNFGGPMRKDKAFYFVAFEHQESDDLIPFTGIDRDGSEGGRMIAPSDNDNFFARFDFNVGSSNTLMFRLSADDRTSSGINVGGVWTPEAGFGIEERDFQFVTSWTSILGPSLINEARLLVGVSEFDQFANSSRPGVTRPSGVFGGNNLNRQARDENRIQLVENLSWRKGPHTLKFGIDAIHSVTDISARFNPTGNFIYNVDAPFEPGDCGDLNVFLVGDAGDDGVVPCPGVAGVDDDGDGTIDEPGNILTYAQAYTLIDGQPQSTLRDTRLALFAQDHWEANRKLVLDYGLRYDVSTYELPSSARVDSTIPNGGAGRDTDNIAPRLGFTFTPKVDGKSVIRGGWGIFYDKLVLAFPAVAAITSGTRIQFHFPEGLADEFTEQTIEDDPDSIDNVFFIDELALEFSTGTEMETPYSVQYNLGFERELTPASALRIDAVRALGYHVPLMIDLNPVTCVPDPDSLVCPLVPQHAGDPTTGSIAAVVTEGRSWYTGVDVTWQYRREASWYSAGYSWSDSEDMGFDPLKGGISLPPDSTDLSGERGRADGSTRHRFVASGDFPLPIGLRASTVIQLSDGVPFNVTTGQDDNFDGILNDRPDGIDRNEGQDSRLDSVNELRALTNEVNAALGLPLLAPVSSLDEPSFFQVDLRVYKQFAVRGGGRAEAYLQVFNLLDRENAGLIEGRATSRNFGETITLAGPPRTLEAGFKISY